MTTTAVRTETTTDSWLRVTLIGIGLGVLGLLMMGLPLLLATQTDEGPFQHASDYVLTVAALPQGVGLFLTTLGFHRLQRGRDGRLGRAGVWVYGICMAELVVQCMASVVVGEELIWGPLYPICAFGLMLGLALLAAGSWKVGLLPRWMLGVWPPLGLLGSFLGVGPVPLLFVVFLVGMAIVLPRRLRSWTPQSGTDRG
jgi:hypothetical protein